MNKKIFLVFLTLLPTVIFAHTLILNVSDNEDNTISVEGMFSTGEIAAGAQIRLESLINGKIIYKKRLPQEGELNIKIPYEPYNIVLDGGPRHKVIKEGIAPLEGFKKSLIQKKLETKENKVKEKGFSKITIILIGIVLAILLFLTTIVICVKNTNRLIKSLQENRTNT